MGVGERGTARSPVVGIIGYGEVGRCFAQRLTERGTTVLVHARSGAGSGPGELVASMAALGEADMVISAVTPVSALDVANQFAPSARSGRVFIDVNSASAEVKRAAAAAVAPASYCDGILTGGGIQLDGADLPMLLAGPTAVATAEWLRDRGLNAQAIGLVVGSAAELKMLRGVIMKGLEALWVEALLAADRLGLVDALIDTVEETTGRILARDLVTMLVTTHVGHARRRSTEVAAIRGTARAAGVEPLAVDGVLGRFRHTATLLDRVGHPSGQVAADLAAALALLGQQPSPTS